MTTEKKEENNKVLETVSQNLFEINQAYYTDPCIVCKHRFREALLCAVCIYFEFK